MRDILKISKRIIFCFTIIFSLTYSQGVQAETSVNINTASINELKQITNVGEIIAQRIIEGRSYDSLSDLIQIKGIGEATLQKIIAQGIATVDTDNEPPEVSPETENHWLIKYKLLKPNFSYDSGEYEYRYTTDNQSRIKTFHTNQLQMTKRNERLPHDSNTLDKLYGDHAGHIAADQFGGSPKLDNIVSQASYVNLSTYKKLENLWARSIKEGKSVQVEIELNYENTARPVSYDIGYVINGVYDSITIINQNPKE